MRIKGREARIIGLVEDWSTDWEQKFMKKSEEWRVRKMKLEEIINRRWFFLKDGRQQKLTDISDYCMSLLKYR